MILVYEKTKQNEKAHPLLFYNVESGEKVINKWDSGGPHQSSNSGLDRLFSFKSGPRIVEKS